MYIFLIIYQKFNSYLELYFDDKSVFVSSVSWVCEQSGCGERMWSSGLRHRQCCQGTHWFIHTHAHLASGPVTIKVYVEWGYWVYAGNSFSMSDKIVLGIQKTFIAFYTWLHIMRSLWIVCFFFFEMLDKSFWEQYIDLPVCIIKSSLKQYK